MEQCQINVSLIYLKTILDVLMRGVGAIDTLYIYINSCINITYILRLQRVSQSASGLMMRAWGGTKLASVCEREVRG